MRRGIYLLPAVALAVVGICLLIQQHSIRALEKETELLQGYLKAARDAERPVADHSRVALIKGTNDFGKVGVIDWKQLIGEVEKNREFSDRSGVKLRKKFKAMDAFELKSALDEFAAIKMTQAVRNVLEIRLFQIVGTQEPEIALNHFIRFLHEEFDERWDLPKVFESWLVEDHQAAALWFEKEIAKGTFDRGPLDNTTDVRMEFEGKMLVAQLATDVTAAKARLAVLSEKQKKAVFSQSAVLVLQPGTGKAFGELIREHIAEDQRANAFSVVAKSMVERDGLEKVSHFLKDIAPNQSEREVIVTEVSKCYLWELSSQKSLEVADLAEMRSWLSQEVPTHMETITGRTLATLPFDRFEGSTEVDLIKKMHEESGSDDLLIGYLNIPKGIEVGEELALAARITNEQKRSAITKRLSKR